MDDRPDQHFTKDTAPEVGRRSSARLTGIGALIQAGLVAPERRTALDPVAERYATGITPEMAALIDPSDPDDPIARQFIPDERELVRTAQELADPIGDGAHSPVEGIVHRYPDRVLLKLLHVCPLYCRFCFRRETVGPGPGQMLDEAGIDAALDYIAADRRIWEVILTGGDPLMLAPRRLSAVLARLGTIDHVRVLRVHSRVPAVDTQRISEELVEALKAGGKTVFLALHVNHPREMTPAARAACARLSRAGIGLLSQTVLLRGINDDLETMCDLMRTFVENGIRPYYLHHADLAPGTSHFRTTIAEGQALVRAMRGRLSGLAQPQYVLDIPGGYGKVPVTGDWISPLPDRAGEPAPARVEDWQGVAHNYPPGRGDT